MNENIQQTLQARAEAATQKQQQGEQLTPKEKRDIARFQEQQTDQLRHEHYATVSKKDFCALANRQRKQIDDLHRNYGAPVDGREVNLYKFVKWVFDFIAKKSRVLSQSENTMADEQLLERKIQEATYTLKCLEIASKKRELISRGETRQVLAVVASHIRSAGLDLQERFGRDALEILSRHLDAAEAEIKASLSETVL